MVGIVDGDVARPITCCVAASSSDTDTVSVVLPVKELSLAKTRIGLPGPDRARLALDLIRHTLDQTLRCPLVGQIVLVTRDPRVIEFAAPFDIAILREPDVSDLNLAAERGRDHAHRLSPDAAVAIMVSDLPYLTTRDVTAYLQQFLSQRAPMYVADHLGSGTTSVVQPVDRRLPYRFGPDSAARHRGLGYRPALGDLCSLRRDLDTPQDLTLFRLETAASTSSTTPV